LGKGGSGEKLCPTYNTRSLLLKRSMPTTDIRNPSSPYSTRRPSSQRPVADNMDPTQWAWLEKKIMILDRDV
jgi:hypothetical protein